MKNLLIGLFSLFAFNSLTSFAKGPERACYKIQSQKSAILIEQVNGHLNAKAKYTDLKEIEGLVVATVETYTGIGGAVYSVTMNKCQVIKVEMVEEIDR